VKGNPPEALTEPTVVITDPANGDVYVAESHTDVEDPNLVGRISVFDKNGNSSASSARREARRRIPYAARARLRLRRAPCRRGPAQSSGPGLTKDGKFVAEYPSFGRGSGLAIDKNDTIYVTDSESTARVHPGWQRGIRIGSVKDGKVTTLSRRTRPTLPTRHGEGVAVDAAGNIYSAEANCGA